MAHGLRFYGNGISFLAAFGQPFLLRALPGGAPVAQSGRMSARRILGGDGTHSVSS